MSRMAVRVLAVSIVVLLAASVLVLMTKGQRTQLVPPEEAAHALQAPPPSLPSPVVLTPPVSPQTPAAASPAPAPSPVEGPAGQLTRDGELELTITTWRSGVRRVRGGYRPEAGQFVIASVTVRNPTDHPVRFRCSDQVLIFNGQRYPGDPVGTTAAVGPNAASRSMAPGELARVQVVFDVPAEVTGPGLSYELHASAKSPGVLFTHPPPAVTDRKLGGSDR
ncbi:MAG: DUF4352 domain-containing protein [Egibacteraceae bacterium]